MDIPREGETQAQEKIFWAAPWLGMRGMSLCCRIPPCRRCLSLHELSTEAVPVSDWLLEKQTKNVSVRRAGAPEPLTGSQQSLCTIPRAPLLPPALLPPLPPPHNYLILLWHEIIECCVSITDVKRFRLPQVSVAHSEP